MTRPDYLAGWTEEVACEGVFAIDKEGRLVADDSSKAIRWCAEGWLRRRLLLGDGDDVSGCCQFLRDSIGTRISAINDSGPAGRDRLRELSRQWAAGGGA